MKNKVRLAFIIFVGLLANSALLAQISQPIASPPGSVTSTVGLTEIQIDYFRPKMKGRKIFGEGEGYLLPYGVMWRTGANSGSKITFSDDVTIEGQSIPAGEYLFFSIPGATQWEVMLYNDISIGGNTANYDKSKEQARFTVAPQKLTETVETLTFNIADISDDNTTAAIQIAWENTSVKLGLKVDFDSKVMAQIEKSTQVSPGTYRDAANYYFNSDRDINQAVEWMETFLNSSPDQQFWNLHTYAKMLQKKGDIEKALATANKSLEMAKAASSDFGYIKLNEELIAQLSKGGKKKQKK